LCATLNLLDTQSYWVHKPDYYHTAKKKSPFPFSKTNHPASGCYHCYPRHKHTPASIQSTSLSHQQDTPTGMNTKIRNKARTDQKGEYINHPKQALLEEHLTNHVVCAKDEHYSAGTAKTAAYNLRHSARAMMLHGNVPKRFWYFAIAHVA